MRKGPQAFANGFRVALSVVRAFSWDSSAHVLVKYGHEP